MGLFDKPEFETAEELKIILDKWFVTEATLLHPATPSHLYTYLGMDWFSILQLKNTDPEISTVINKALGLLELQIINKGFLEDKSFSRYYLDRYIPVQVQETQETEKEGTTVIINLDTSERQT